MKRLYRKVANSGGCCSGKGTVFAVAKLTLPAVASILMTAGNTSSSSSSSREDTSRSSSDFLLAGRCLLEVAQHVQSVAPVAFMIGAVIQACRRAKVLQDDCAKFARVIETVELSLCRCFSSRSTTTTTDDDDGGNLPSIIRTIEEILDEAMIHVSICNSRGKFARFLHSENDSETFASLSNKLYNACSMLQLDEITSLHVMVQQQYLQSDALQEKLQQQQRLGKDINEELVSRILTEIETATTHNQSLAAAAVVKEIQQSTESTKGGIEDIQQALQLQNSDFFEWKQSMQEKFDKDMEMMKRQNDILVKQIYQMQCMMTEQSMKLSRFMDLFPIPYNEAYRQRTMDRRKLRELARSKQPGEDPIDLLCVECLGEMAPLNLKIIFFILVGDEHDSVYSGFIWVPDSYQPTAQQRKDLGDKLQHVNVPGRSGGYAAGVKETFEFPKKLDSCQYTVAWSKENLRSLAVWEPKDKPFLFPDTVDNGAWIQTMVRADPNFGPALEKCSTHPVLVLETDIYLPRGNLEDSHMAYCGKKVMIDGHCIGSLCFMYDTEEEESQQVCEGNDSSIVHPNTKQSRRLWNENEHAIAEKYVSKLEETLIHLTSNNCY